MANGGREGEGENRGGWAPSTPPLGSLLGRAHRAGNVVNTRHTHLPLSLCCGCPPGNRTRTGGARRHLVPCTTQGSKQEHKVALGIRLLNRWWRGHRQGLVREILDSSSRLQSQEAAALPHTHTHTHTQQGERTLCLRLSGPLCIAKGPLRPQVASTAGHCFCVRA
jgi:hypothetical protein